MEELRGLRDTAKANGQISAAIKAEWLRGRLCGFYSDKIEPGVTDEFDHMTSEQLRRIIVEGTQALGIDLSAPKARAKVEALSYPIVRVHPTSA